jgi:ABC-type Fe3+/spermidine/putrescine transport system ATPase subunit
MSTLTLDALVKRFSRGDTVIGPVVLEVADGELFTLLGPSGCGKSTTLRMVAGFEEPTSGRVLFGDRDVSYTPPNKRGVGLVFQNYALFPHMDVRTNVGFGLQVRHLEKDEVARLVGEALEQVRLTGLDKARVDQLSGGQQQRVALARALVIRPSLLLLDEPLSNLDAKLREETRAALRQIHAETGVTTLYVTHDQAEAMALSDRVAVFREGTIHQVGTPEEVYDRPATSFVAGFIGRNNLLPATISSITSEGLVVRLDAGYDIEVRTDRLCPGLEPSIGLPVTLSARAEGLRLTPPGEPGVMSGVVVDVEYQGAVRTARADVDGHVWVVDVFDGTRPAPGDAVGVVVSSDCAFLTEAA